MKNSVEDILQKFINTAVDFIGEIVENNSGYKPLSYNNRRDVNETLEAFYQLLSLDIINPEDNVALKMIFKSGEHVIHEKLLHFGNYYYSKQKLIHSELFEKEESLRRTNVETASMLARIRAYQLHIEGIGGSTDDYFIERMPKLLDGISFIINKNISEVYLPAFYNLLNLHNTLIKYIESEHPTFRSAINELQKKVIVLIDKLATRQEIINIISKNISISLFYDQYLFFKDSLSGIDYSLKNKFNQDFDHFTISQKLRALTSWSILDHTFFFKNVHSVLTEIQYSQNLSIADSALGIRVISFYLKKTSVELLDVKVPLKNPGLDIGTELKNIFNGIDQIAKITLTENEKNLLYSYNDSQLREKVAACIINVPINEIDREMRKPHGVSEISDMELKVNINGKRSYLCMPFKTGKEVNANSVSIDVFYQILRPFFHFDNCAVVFITAKSCSQNLMNEIKRAQDKYEFSIEVIENFQLAKLLKFNNQLN
ncbi:hypothetical protein [Mucilaginibacter polytrichastri]|uniref:Uncharacterized protein n=1 Tax=Mucilaginibacter polytrichastri TaxID=1302689 RepID=A0A1Q6A4V4_9SPHI|nr:hypothetical protein [Mucilaginibacter polytrichastri]OKS89038.1 hypothetical protein RG47T_4518 [Mucilaginibacter polytrichastri]SFS95671.1 hypothetical protein SAMN04487890_10780 [Mucilaginibacter polytrichastri]